MTVPHDEQPLTRRQLRDLERQKPRKQQKEEAKAAEEAEAKRRAEEEAQAAAERAAFEAEAARAVLPTATSADAATDDRGDATSTPPVEGAEADAPAADVSTAPEAESAAPATPDAETASAETAVGESAAPNDEHADDDEPDGVSPAPILSRRARRALSADHPLAEQNAQLDDETEAAPAAIGAAAAATGPIIAEMVVDDEPDVDSENVTSADEDVLTAETASHASSAAEASGDTAAAPMVEELMVVDDAPEISAEEEDELAEIDDTPEPDPVQIVTIDETPSAPILAPLFQAKAAEPDRTVNKVDLTQSSFDDLIASRGVGSSNSVASTSALVLPSVPNHGDVGTALDETGEVIITGSIDLPMSLGSTGAAPADGLESAELDAFLDPESEIGSDVAPVSATRAISTHGPSSGLVAPPKRRGANAPVILAVTAGVLAVGVVGLLLAAFVFRIF